MEVKDVYKFIFKESFVRDFLSFLIPTTVIILLPGPTYIAGFIFVYCVFLYIIRKSLPLALFQMYLLSMVYGEEVLSLPGVLVQNNVFFKLPVLLSVPVKIPLRFILFIVFALSFIGLHKKDSLRRIIKPAKYIPLVLIETIIILISLGQIFGDYSIRYRFTFLQVIQIFMVFPVVYYFLHGRAFNKQAAEKIKNLFLHFAVFALSFEGIIAIIQFILKYPLGINTESQFDLNFVVAAETGQFRSPGTLAHPNYLGVFSGMLLPIIIAETVKAKQDKTAARIIKTSLVLGFSALFLSFSRWSWISFLIGAVITIAVQRGQFIRYFEKLRLSMLNIIIFAFVLLVSVNMLLRFSKFTTIKGRVEIFNIAMTQMISDPLWGVGPGNSTVSLVPFKLDIESYLRSLKGVHNTFLLIGAELGVPVFFIFISFIIYMLIKHVSPALKSRGRVEYAVLFIIFVINCIAYPLYIWDPSLELFFVVSAFLFYFNYPTVK